MKEPPTFRLELEQILARFDGKSMLTITDVSTYLGRSRKWCRDHLGMTGDGITAVNLALRLSRGEYL